VAELGLDYSDTRPGGALLKAHNVQAVGRYLATDSRGITAAEYADLQAYGIGLWVVFESQTRDLSVSMLNGYAKGVSDAQRALAQIVAQGLPPDSPIYWAADFDIAPGTDRVAAAESYVDGWNTVIPAGRRGGYGGLWFLDYIHGRGKVDFLWECASTSFRHGVDPGSVPLHIQQTVETPPIPGTDHNYIYDTTSFAGQHATNLSEEDDDMPKYELFKVVGDTSGTIYLSVNRAMRYPLTKQAFQDYQYYFANTLHIDVPVQSVVSPASFGPLVLDDK
jgi:hypothetical protein